MLESYLEGLSVERVGQEFTVDLKAQSRKMAAFLEREPALWILLAVQAAVRAGARSVHLGLTREMMEIRFVSLDEADLGQALMAALAAPSQAVSLFLGDKALYGAGYPGRGREYRLHLRRPARSWLSFGDPLAAQVHRSLYRRCGLSSVPIWLDGRLLNQGWLEEVGMVPAATANPGFGEGAVKYRWLAQASWLAEREPRFPLTCPLLRSSYRTRLVRGSWRPGRAWASRTRPTSRRPIILSMLSGQWRSGSGRSYANLLLGRWLTIRFRPR
ncbi:MAG: hypothetical protein J0I12_25350 [Candidatus Eremiobacteraeota bacterium]|nr:hypothetical protein [Candidatus Eremiobacteraeota bacterium]